MSLGVFSVFLLGLLIALALDPRTRGRILFTTLCALTLGIVIAGSDGVLVKPAHLLVDGIRTGLTAASQYVAHGSA